MCVRMYVNMSFKCALQTLWCPRSELCNDVYVKRLISHTELLEENIFMAEKIYYLYKF